ncbi:heat shock 70 kDa protein 16-like [Dorcoceras hygrometricum]|uniref:Heat shock 70 kDa protein 16-like n=1 Tax=Dorcoceras hygrometricum TaxID=472368 RepID=A0A2Z7BYB0_9LAMI|nr:heat shock 70 kDa protein 16-like [Dorcoceras hygrometricum]
MSVVGFDIGNENSVIAAAKQRGIDVLLNDESKRETPTVVSFGEKQRFLGSAGAASATMHPKSTIYQIKRLIGRKFGESIVQNDLKLFPFEASEGPDGGILIHLQYLDEKQSFTPIQILAMFLAHLKQVTEKNLETHITDCVIGIPSYFTDLQRRAYLQAAEIAGLTPLRLMHDCTATALGYGIYKTDFLSNSSTNIVFVDVGHSDTQVAVVSFSPRSMKVLSHAFDNNLGGRDFDEVLFRYFATQFQEQDNIDVCASPRASIRLRAACEKLKKVLSANPEAPLNIECLMEEKDVKGYIKRDVFEKLSSDLLERVKATCHRALLDSGLTVEMVHTVELVGSGSRIPAITKILNSLFLKEPRRTINASECVALGCAIQCAMLSPTFHVREYEVQDSFPFSIGLASYVRQKYILEQVQFPKRIPFPSTKILKLRRSDDFYMGFFYTNQEELPLGVPTTISSFKIGPVRVSHSEKAKIKIKVHLNLHGIVTLVSASLFKHLLDDSTVNNSNPLVSENGEPSIQDYSGEADGLADHERQMLKYIRHNLLIEENVDGGLMLGELSQAQEKESQLTQQDIKMERTKDKKNTLESYVYETRNKLLNKYRSFATDSEKEEISSNLQQTEEWLYDGGDDESEYVYTRKLEDLKKIVSPIENRFNDEEARALATRGLLNRIEEYGDAVKSLPPGERDAVLAECRKAEHWLREKSQQQDSLPKNADPVLWSSHITEKTEALAEMCKQLIPPRPSFSNPEGVKDSETRGHRDDMDVD